MNQVKTEDFTTTLVVDKTPHEAFEAINNVRGWWSETVEGGTHQLNDVFVYQYKDIHASTQKLIEIVPDKKVVWLVTDSLLSFVKLKSEWTGTKIIFEISKKGDQTEVKFTHQGLDPQVECFNDCSGGWDYYLQRSLLPLIQIGTGNPDKKNDTKWSAN